MNIADKIQEIMDAIDKFIYDDKMTQDEKASFIIGATMMRDDYHEIIKVEPEVLNLAELASDYEAYHSDYSYDDEDYQNILNKIDLIRKKYKKLPPK